MGLFSKPKTATQIMQRDSNREQKSELARYRKELARRNKIEQTKHHAELINAQTKLRAAKARRAKASKGHGIFGLKKKAQTHTLSRKMRIRII
jgi:hypothetical protein